MDTSILRTFRLALLAGILLFTTITVHAAETLGSYASHAVDHRSVVFTTTQGQRLRLTPYGANIVRVQAVRKGEEFFPDDRYEMVEHHDWPGALRVDDDGARFIITAGTDPEAVRITVMKNPMRLRFLDFTGHVQLADNPGIAWDDSTVRTTFAYDLQEHFTGLGHGYFARSEHLDLRGESIERNYGSAHGQQAPLIVPFYYSSKRYGIFVNSTFPNRFTFGKNELYDVALKGGRMDYFFISGQDFAHIAERYTALTGRPRLPERAFFGLALSDKAADHTTATPSDESWWKKKITEQRSAGFPIDHIINDNRWRAGGGKRCESYFAWDAERYPDPAEYERWIKANGLVLTIDFNRCIGSHSEGWKPSFNIPDTAGIDFGDSAPDFTQQAVRDWFWHLHWTKSLDPKLKYPGDALWIDEFDEMGAAPLAMTLSNGRTWAEMRNYWFFLIAKSLVQNGWDRQIGESRRPFVWVRGMTAGAQRYATLWSGDIRPTYSDMKAQIRSMQLAGLAGFPYWGHDAGGFHDWESGHGPDEPMYRQWSMAMGSFSPFWKPHGMGQSRWPLDRSIESQHDAHVYCDLRYELMPYTYTIAHEAAVSGMPMARAMVFGHESDPRAWAHDLEYMWGSSFLVAPNCSNGDDVPVWLPEGKWYDYWTDRMIDGGAEFKQAAPLGVLPLFVKAGAIVPMAPMALSTQFIPKDSLIIHVYTGANGIFTLYEDDDVSERYRTQKEFRTTAMTYTNRTRTLAIAPSQGVYHDAPDARVCRVVFHGVTPEIAARVEVNGNSFARTGAGASAQTTVVWNEKANMVTVSLPRTPVTQPIEIRLAGM